MVKERNKEENHEYFGKKLLSWNFPEYDQFQRGLIWYLATFIVCAGLLTWAIVGKNFLFAGIILIGLIVIFITSRRKPENVDILIFENGVGIGSKFYPYKKIKKFWIAYEPPVVKKLYLEVEGITKPLMSISLEKENPLKVRDILVEYVIEDIENEGESASDAWERLLKL